MNIIGHFDEGGSYDIRHDNSFLIEHPNILVSGTRVVIFFTLSTILHISICDFSLLP